MPCKKSDIRFSWFDMIALVGFALLAISVFIGRWKGLTPFVFLSSDAGIVSSFVSAYQHPTLFKGDVLLGDFTNFRYYLAIHPLLILGLNKLIGDYGLAYIALLLVTVFVQCCGFYLLGLKLFRNRYWALLLVIINLAPVALPVREFWGIYDDPLPRSLFHAFLPFLLAAAFRFKYERWAWPWIMVATGLIFYTHPVSAPPWALAIWLGFWIFLPSEWRILKKIGYMFMLGLLFVLTVTPWAINLILVHGRSASAAVSYNDVVGIIADRVGPELLSVGVALKLWSVYVLSWPFSLYLIWAGVGAILMWYFREDLRDDLKLIVTWCLGILLVSVCLTFAEQTICQLFDFKRFQMDSIRGVKYLVPIMLLMCLWSLSAISSQFTSRSFNRVLINVVGLIITIFWVGLNPPADLIEMARAWRSGRLMPKASRTEIDTIRAIKAIRNITAPGSRILPLVLPLEVRYAARRPIVYAYKDGGIFADTNLGSLLEWNKAREQVERIASTPNLTSQLEITLGLAKKLKANYVLMELPSDRKIPVIPDLKVLWRNSSYVLLSVE
ncbi:MAG: hypothetical protein ACP5U1_07455 [Desulfomonilaceae bacterium]